MVAVGDILKDHTFIHISAKRCTKTCYVVFGFILLHVIVLFRVLTNFTNDKMTIFYIIDCNNVLKTQ